jgi:hydroxymethylbilane synthase
VALSPDGAVAVRRSATGSPKDAEKLGRGLAQEMLDDGASALIEEQAS